MRSVQGRGRQILASGVRHLSSLALSLRLEARKALYSYKLMRSCGSKICLRFVNFSSLLPPLNDSLPLTGTFSRSVWSSLFSLTLPFPPIQLFRDSLFSYGEDFPLFVLYVHEHLTKEKPGWFGTLTGLMLRPLCISSLLTYSEAGTCSLWHEHSCVFGHCSLATGYY
jgi:hypothetical protein